MTEDKFLFLPNDKSSFSFPNFLLPAELHNEGNYVISLNLLVRWLGERAEELGVEIYPGFSASEVVYREVSTSQASKQRACQRKYTQASGAGNGGVVVVWWWWLVLLQHAFT